MYSAIEPGRLIKVGELLVGAGLLTSGDVIEATQVSKRLGIPIGRILLASGCLSESTLQVALQAQLLLREGEANFETAAEALRQAANGLTFQEALSQLNVDKVGGETEVKDISTLLLDSAIATTEQLQMALDASAANGISLAAALVVHSVLSPQFYPTFARMLDRLRSRDIDHAQAATELNTSFAMWLKADQSLREEFDGTDPFAHVFQTERYFFTTRSNHSRRTKKQHIKTSVIDLLSDAGIITEQEIKERCEEMLADPERSSELLKLLDLLDRSTLVHAKKCQLLVQRRLISRMQAVQAIRKRQPDLSELEEDENWAEPLKNQAAVPPVKTFPPIKSMSKALGGTLLGALAGWAIFGWTKAKR